MNGLLNKLEKTSNYMNSKYCKTCPKEYLYQICPGRKNGPTLRCWKENLKHRMYMYLSFFQTIYWAWRTYGKLSIGLRIWLSMTH